MDLMAIKHSVNSNNQQSEHGSLVEEQLTLNQEVLGLIPTKCHVTSLSKTH